MADTFCIRAFEHLCLNLDGSVQLCCRASRTVLDEARPFSLATDAYPGIWNSPYMRSVRQAFLSGRRIPDCVVCYAHEGSMGTSLRTESNAAWLQRQPAAERASALERLKARSEAAGHLADARPSTLHLWFGSHCNLQCRMCSAEFSTRIAADPVHSAWHGGRTDPAPARTRFGDAEVWSESSDLLFGEIFADVEGLEAIAFAGGEPLLQKQIEPLLDWLIQRGRAPFVRLFISTNGTVSRRPLMEKLGRFQRAVLAVSLDGVGALNDYVRYPSRWDALYANLQELKACRGIQLRVDPTIQAYNVLALADLLRFCDAEGLEVSLSNMLVGPPYLAVSALPKACIEVARQRLEEYLGQGCPPRNVVPVEAVLSHLSTLPVPEHPALLDALMTFTNDLDVSRGQRIGDAAPELVALLAQAGFPWKSTHRHVSNAPLLAR